MGHVEVEEISEGVYKLCCDDAGPESFEYNGFMLYRFMDKFYISNEHLDEMSRTEVNSLCRARARFPELITGVNKQVKEFFRSFVHAYSPRSILEIGAGRHPLFDTSPIGVEYVLADADTDVKNGLDEKTDFKEFSESSPKLIYEDGYFHLIIAIFVMQFPFCSPQIEELSRCLADDGVCIVNVYRRRPEARKDLINALTMAGLIVKVLPDPQNLCRDHEYWAIAKDSKKAEQCLSVLSSIVA
ncbi:hypothetical protein [Pseudomonas aeruginosa]